MTAKGKIQRIACSEVSTIGRNTQGVRIMKLEQGDSLAAVVRVPKEEPNHGKPEAETRNVAALPEENPPAADSTVDPPATDSPTDEPPANQ